MNPKHTRILRVALALGLAAALSACGSVGTNRFDGPDTATRAAPVESSLTTRLDAAPQQAVLPTFTVVGIDVNVPQTLRVSEANRYYPGGDIVWREDPIGDRHQQVKAIMTAGLSKGVANFQGERQVVLDVVVTRFHALTEKARYTVGGVHAIQFEMRVRDAQTGEIIVPSHHIKADFDALGGRAAIQAESRGITQKVRITNQLAYVIQQELGRPGGYVAQDNGLIGALNQL